MCRRGLRATRREPRRSVCGRRRASRPRTGGRGGWTAALIPLLLLLASPSPALWEYESDSHYVSIGGFLDTSNAIRLASPGNFFWGKSETEPARVLLQRNQARVAISGSHPGEVYTQINLDLVYASGPDFPFDDYNEIEIDEAYVDFRVKNIDWRVGKEKAVWGKIDIISPFDILTASNTKAPLVAESIEDRIGQWGVKANYDWERYRLQAVYYPIWTHSISPEAETDLQEGSTPGEVIFGETIGDAWFPPVAIYPQFAVAINDPNYNYFAFTASYERTDPRKATLKTGTIGIRAGALHGDWDSEVYFVSAMDPLPHPEISAIFSEGSVGGAPAVVLNFHLALRHSRLHTIGAATSRTFGRLGFRSEMSFTTGHYWYRLFDESSINQLIEDFNTTGLGQLLDTGAEHSTFRLTVGGDIEIPNTGLFTSNQLAINHGFGHKDFYFQDATEVVMTNAVRRPFIDDHLAVMWVDLISLSRGTVWLRPSVAYTLPQFEDLQFSTGFNAFIGNDFSIIGSFTDHSNWIFTARLYY